MQSVGAVVWILPLIGFCTALIYSSACIAAFWVERGLRKEMYHLLKEMGIREFEFQGRALGT
jgi:hypothetical protein